jgi:hypothetical protein
VGKIGGARPRFPPVVVEREVQVVAVFRGADPAVGGQVRVALTLAAVVSL